MYDAYAAEVGLIQRGTVSITNTSVSVTIDPVCTAQSVLFFSVTTDDADPGDVAVGGELVDETTITFHRNNGAGATGLISWQVIEFESGVSVQRGSVSGFNAAGTNVTISAVTLANSFVLVSAIREGTSWSSDDGITANLSASTNIFIDVNAGTAGTAYWQVVEYNDATVQRVTTTLSSGSASTTSAISAVDPAKTFVVGSSYHDATVNADDLPRTELTNSTTLTFTRVGTTGTHTFVSYVVELNDASTVSRGNATFGSGVTNQSVAITGDIDASIVNGPGSQGRQGSSSHSSDDNLGHVWFRYQITSATNLEVDRAIGTSSTANAPWEVITFEDNYKHTTYYSFATGAWDANTSWSLTSDGSSGAAPAGAWPRRGDDAVINTAHTITVDAVDDNLFCGVAADDLNRANVGTGFPGGTVAKFYHTGDLLIGGTLVFTNGIGIMLEGFTYVDDGGTLQTSGAGSNDDILNLGYMEIAPTAILLVGDDLQMSGNSITIIDNLTIAVDDIYLDNTDATLCGSGSATIADDVQFFNSATVAQICSQFTITCGGTCATGTGSFDSGNTGPGGVGSTDGTGTLEYWIDANSGVTGSAPITAWTELSGNGVTNTVNGDPQLVTSVLNGQSVGRFDGVGDIIQTNLSINESVFADLTTLAVYAPNGVNVGAVWGELDAGFDRYLVDATGGCDFAISDGSACQNDAALFQDGIFVVTSAIFDEDAVNGTFAFVNGTQELNFTANHGPNTSNNLQVAAIGSSTNVFRGDIAEVIMRSEIDAAERIIMENYLSAKYGLAMGSNDVYTMDNGGNGDFDFEVAGVGQAADGSNHRDAQGTGIVRVFNPNDLDNGEFLIFGHDNTSLNDANTIDVDGAVIEARLDREWRLSESGDVGTVSISFDVSGFSTLVGSDLRLLIDRNDNGFMDNDVTPIAGSFVGGVVTFSSVNFSDADRFTLGTADATNSPLPIELSAFRAVPVEAGVSVQWSTASETNNDYFTVERSADLKFWSEVAEVEGAGFSNETVQYEIIDDGELSGVVYYRLKQTDYDGTYEYSHTVSVFVGDGEEIRAYPNPSDGTFTVTNAAKYQVQNVRVMNILGQRQLVNISKSGTNILIDGTLLKDGVYLLELRNGFDRRTVRLLKH